MAKKKPTKKFKGLTMVDKLPNNQGEWLELVIKNTQKSLGGRTDASLQYLRDQEERLKAQLAEWKAANPQ